MGGASVAHYLLATLDMLEGRLASSRDHIRTLDSLNRAVRRQAMLQTPAVAAAFWVSGDTTAGVRTLDSAVAADSTNRSFNVAQLYAQFGKPDVALSIVNVVDSVHDGFPQIFGRSLVTGWVAMARGQPRAAVDSFRASQMASDGPVMASPIAVDPNVGLAFERAQLPDSAIGAYEHYLNAPPDLEDNALRLPWVLEHVAALYDRKGMRREAKDAYMRFVDLWRDADPELQPRVAHARERIAALSR
jgi:tetratricopeptide (TPR) repeat protein